MNITIGSVLLLIAFFFVMVRAKDAKEQFASLLLITIVVELFIGRGFFVKVGEHETTFSTICEYALFVMAVYFAVSMRVRLDKRGFLRVYAFVASLIIGWLLLIVFPTGATGANLSVTWDMVLLEKLPRAPIVFSSSMMGYLLRILTFSLVAIVAFSAFDDSDWDRLVGKTVKSLQVLVLVCTIEVIAKYGFGSNLFHDVVDMILGQSSSTYLYINQRGDGFLLNGLTKEGSHYVFALSISLLLFMYARRRGAESNLQTFNRTISIAAVVAAVIELALSMTFSVIWFAVCVALAILVLRCKRKPALQIVVLVAFALALIAAVAFVVPFMSDILSADSYFGRRLKALDVEMESIMNGTWLNMGSSGDWSIRVRLGSAFETLLLLQFRPLVGLGFGSVSAHSSLAVMCTGCGVIGTALYFNAFYRSLAPSYNKQTYYSLIVCFLLMTLFVSLGYGPFYQMWPLVLLYVFRSISLDDAQESGRRISPLAASNNAP